MYRTRITEKKHRFPAQNRAFDSTATGLRENLGTGHSLFGEVPGHTDDLATILNEELSDKWKNLRGVEIVFCRCVQHQGE